MNAPIAGSAGKNIQVRSNFFPLEIPKIPIFHYSVSITPTVPPAKNRSIFMLWEQESNALGLLEGIKPVFDGRFNMYSPAPIFGGEMSTYQIDYYDEDEYPQCECPRLECNERRPKTFEMTLTKITTINMDSLRCYLKGITKVCPEEAIKALDVILQHRPALSFTTIGHGFYTSDQALDIANGLELWQGFHQSVVPAAGRMLVNLDVTATAFHKGGPVLEISSILLKKGHFSNFKVALNKKEIEILEEALIGLKIIVTHRGQIRRKYRIQSITNSDCSTTFFSVNGSGANLAVSDYFREKYQINLAFPHLPCIVVGTADRPAYFPLEVCQIVPAQRNLRKLNERQTGEMIRFTCQPPHIRSNKISAGRTLLQQKDDEYLSDFGVEIGTEMISLPCRVLPAPTLSFHPASKEAQLTPRSGIWNLRDKQLAQGATLVSWSVLVFSTEELVPMKSVQKFVTLLCETCEECGVFIESKQPPISYSANNIEQSLIESFMVAGDSYNLRPQLILCILPNTGVSLYAEIKRVSDTIIGVGTQCVQAKHIFTSKKQYCANVCLKMNVKLGGMNAFLSSAQLPFVSSKPTIVIGADITHPTAGSANPTSIAALVGSLDAQCSRYSSAIRTQSSSEDAIEDIGGMFVELLKTFYHTSGVKPLSVLLYRNAANDTQFNMVANEELQSIFDACESLERGYRPRITFVAVQKRHHARFFPIKGEDADESGNVRSGTVIDREITHPSQFDFYLFSHAGMQGTSKPCHYLVLHDENNFTSDGLQELTYRLCFLYCRATRTVSVVPPVYYAHIVATRARFHSKDISEKDLRFQKIFEGAVKVFAPVKNELAGIMYYM